MSHNHHPTFPVSLTIAGSDPSGGAGLQADLKTFHQHAVYGMSVVTLLTVQNTRTVQAVELLAPEFVSAQLDAVLDDIPPTAAKTGAIGSSELIHVVAEHAKHFAFPLVVDPVMISKHGASLMDETAVDTLIRELLPQAFLVTPNRFEASRLTGLEITSKSQMEVAAAKIAALGVPHVLIKGLQENDECIDLLWTDGAASWLSGRWVDTPSTHGSGCVYSAAITARLAKGEGLHAAVHGAKEFITHAIRTAPGLGQGRGPVNLFAPIRFH